MRIYSCEGFDKATLYDLADCGWFSIDQFEKIIDLKVGETITFTDIGDSLVVNRLEDGTEEEVFPEGQISSDDPNYDYK